MKANLVDIVLGQVVCNDAAARSPRDPRPAPEFGAPGGRRTPPAWNRSFTRSRWSSSTGRDLRRRPSSGLSSGATFATTTTDGRTRRRGTVRRLTMTRAQRNRRVSTKPREDPGRSRSARRCRANAESRFKWEPGLLRRRTKSCCTSKLNQRSPATSKPMNAVNSSSTLVSVRLLPRGRHG